MNKPNREISIMESIRLEILAIEPRSQVEIKEMCVPSFTKFVFEFRPNAIVTFPFTSIGFARWYYVFKFIFKSKILCFRAEGVIDLDSEYNIKLATGADSYDEHLVDYELFWGEKVGNKIAQELINQKKLSSNRNVKIVGYPRLESYFGNSSFRQNSLPTRILFQIDKFDKANIFLFVTGFHLANYSKKNLIDAKDLHAESMMSTLLDGVEILKDYRSEWIANIKKAAIENPTKLFILKKHPIENKSDYLDVLNISNILFIYEDIQVDSIIPYSCLFFHYGSTSLIDAYLSNIPSVYIYSKKYENWFGKLGWFTDLGWPSSRRIDIGSLEEVIVEYDEGKIFFEKTELMSKVMKDIFNIEDEAIYSPSKKIAEIILHEQSQTHLSIFNIFLIKSLFSISLELFLSKLYSVWLKIKPFIKK